MEVEPTPLAQQSRWLRSIGTDETTNLRPKLAFLFPLDAVRTFGLFSPSTVTPELPNLPSYIFKRHTCLYGSKTCVTTKLDGGRKEAEKVLEDCQELFTFRKTRNVGVWREAEACSHIKKEHSDYIHPWGSEQHPTPEYRHKSCILRTAQWCSNSYSALSKTWLPQPSHSTYASLSWP